MHNEARLQLPVGTCSVSQLWLMSDSVYSQGGRKSQMAAGCGCSVEFSLLPVAEQLASWPADAGPFRPITSVQLQTRHWIVRDSTGEVAQDIRGDGVVGRHPILLPGLQPGPCLFSCLSITCSPQFLRQWRKTDERMSIRWKCRWGVLLCLRLVWSSTNRLLMIGHV